MNLKRKLVIIIVTNTLLLQNLYLNSKGFNARLAQKKLVTKADSDTRLQSLSKKIDASYFRGKEYFGTGGLQKFLVFQPMSKFLKKIGGSGKI